MAQLEERCCVIETGTRGNSARDQPVSEGCLVAVCSSGANPKMNNGSEYAKHCREIPFKHTVHVWLKREMVDESSAAKIDRGVLKFCNEAQRYFKIYSVCERF